MSRIIVILLIFSVIDASAQTDLLTVYLEMGARNNPGVMAAFHNYEAALERVPQAGALEDPQFDAGFFLKPMEIIDGQQIAQFELMQMFNWFGTRKAAKTEAQHMAQMAFEQFREARDDLFLRIYEQWYVLNRLQQRLMNNRENTELLRQLETLALRRFSAGGSPGTRVMPPVETATLSTPSSSSMNMADMSRKPDNTATNTGGMSMSASSGTSGGMSEALRIRLEIAEMENNEESILSEIEAEKARFNALLNKPATSEIVIPDTFPKTQYIFDIKDITSLVFEQNPMLGMYHEETLVYEAKEEMNRKMGYPMLGIGLQYMLIGSKAVASDMTDMSGSTGGMNGRDMLMPMVSVSIPLYRGKYSAAMKEARFQRLAAQAKYDDTRNLLEAELYRLKHELDDAERKITLYHKQTELARTTYDLLVREFISGNEGLSEILQVQRQLLDYKLKTSEATADFNTGVARVQKFISNLGTREEF